MSFFVGKLCSCGFIVELCCLAEITLKTIHRWPYLAGPRSLLVPLLCPNVFIWLNVPLLISVIVFSHLDTIKDYVMLCCYVSMNLKQVQNGFFHLASFTRRPSCISLQNCT